MGQRLREVSFIPQWQRREFIKPFQECGQHVPAHRLREQHGRGNCRGPVGREDRDLGRAGRGVRAGPAAVAGAPVVVAPAGGASVGGRDSPAGGTAGLGPGLPPSKEVSGFSPDRLACQCHTPKPITKSCAPIPKPSSKPASREFPRVFQP
jgi:hypothetical protein